MFYVSGTLYDENYVLQQHGVESYQVSITLCFYCLCFVCVFPYTCKGEAQLTQECWMLTMFVPSVEASFTLRNIHAQFQRLTCNRKITR